ncbi:pyridoxamine 5'-phosphate oxidase family protein [Pedobacter gandavensis]|uniref:pyridoxamine 5'-phosphate oxidase family protein n=1 Tax=Pedobacter gandavensis TaxID=2679963 RepID=UPI00292F4231|nr:pyridoxamine 5'-phosphate oxidase family protein [Pedobacter gandavensis]
MSTENLAHREAIEKLKTMVDKIDIGMMCTNTSDLGKLHAVPMSRQEVDHEGNLWFLISSDSETYKNLQKSNQISVLYSDISKYRFLSINGIGEISKDQARIEKYWNKMMDGWFEKGKEDPSIRILKISPSEGHYWDNESNKLITFLKVAASAISGEKIDIGREGNLNI